MFRFVSLTLLLSVLSLQSDAFATKRSKSCGQGFQKTLAVAKKKSRLNLARLNASLHSNQEYRDAENQIDFNPKKLTWNGDGIQLSKTLGKGYRARVVLSESGRVFKIAKDAESAQKLTAERLINEDLQENYNRYHIRVDQIVSHGPADYYLEKKLIDPNTIASEMINSNFELSSAQLETLKRVFAEARRYAQDTGIGLDIKASNLYWDSELQDWILFDCGHRSSYLPMGYTLDLKTFEDYLSVWLKEEPDTLEGRLTGLLFEDIIEGSQDEMEDLLYNYLELPLPRAVRLNAREKTKTLPIEEIHFMQRSCNYRSSSEKGRHLVLSNARALREGKLKVEQLPVIQVWKDETGKIWTINHRRLLAMLMSGVVRKVPVVWAEPEEVHVASNENKYYPLNDGRSTYLVMPREGLAVLVTHDRTARGVLKNKKIKE